MQVKKGRVLGAVLIFGVGMSAMRHMHFMRFMQRAMSRVHGRMVLLNTFILAELLVLAGGAILPAPAVPASTTISARLKRVVNTIHSQQSLPRLSLHCDRAPSSLGSQ